MDAFFLFFSSLYSSLSAPVLLLLVLFLHLRFCVSSSFMPLANFHILLLSFSFLNALSFYEFSRFLSHVFVYSLRFHLKLLSSFSSPSFSPPLHNSLFLSEGTAKDRWGKGGREETDYVHKRNGNHSNDICVRNCLLTSLSSATSHKHISIRNKNIGHSVRISCAASPCQQVQRARRLNTFSCFFRVQQILIRISSCFSNPDQSSGFDIFFVP